MNCVVCKKPATLACGGCKICPAIPGDEGVVRYCGVGCQRQDWTAHKGVCLRLKDRMALSRVAGLGQGLFYIAREMELYSMDIKTIDFEEKEMEMERKVYKMKPTYKEALNIRGIDVTPDPLYQKRIAFPAHLFKSQEHQQAALSFGGADYGIDLITEVFKGMLPSGIIKENTYIQYETMGELRRTRWKPYNCSCGTGIEGLHGLRKPRHSVLKVTLRSGEAYAIDLAGAQFGHYEPVVAWKHYNRERIWEITYECPAAKALGQIEVSNYTNENIERLHCRSHCIPFPIKSITEDMMMQISMDCMHWQQENMSLKDMFKLPSNSKYIGRQRELIDYINWRFNYRRPGYTKPQDGYGTVSGMELRHKIGEEWPHHKD